MHINDVLRKNKSLKNIHAGKRCFLIGNGPSVKTQDLTLLRNEISIVVSSFFRHPDADIIEPNYWILADPAFSENPDKHFTPLLELGIKKGITTKLFVPSGGYSYFSNCNLGPLIDVNFFHYDYGRDHSMPIDFSTGIPRYGQNVMIVSLMLAFHLGCNPIYFLGCDHDFYKITEETYKSSSITHFYHEEKTSKYIKDYTWENWNNCMNVMHDQYGFLRSYASDNGYCVFNATEGGCLETFPRVMYNSLFTGSTGHELANSDIDPLHFYQSVIDRINSKEYLPALILLDEALRININRPQRVEGLEYLKALCLTNLGKPKEALLWARQDYNCNQNNRHNVVPLIKRLELYLN